jgi:hypothetical protein
LSSEEDEIIFLRLDSFEENGTVRFGLQVNVGYNGPIFTEIKFTSQILASFYVQKKKIHLHVK